MIFCIIKQVLCIGKGKKTNPRKREKVKLTNIYYFTLIDKEYVGNPAGKNILLCM